MKSLLIIRHAKSNWDSSVLNDFDRPLNERGKRDAPQMAKRLISKKISIDLFVSSPAKRAKTTAEFFVDTFKKDKDGIIFFPSLYHAPVDVFYQVITGFDDTCNSAAIFSHNPGITSFVNTLTATQIDNMPTCGVFAVNTDTDSWRNFSSSKKQFWFFDYPKLA
jgi:phosphohistidine phosphatase